MEEASEEKLGKLNNNFFNVSQIALTAHYSFDGMSFLLFHMKCESLTFHEDVNISRQNDSVIISVKFVICRELLLS